MSDFTTKKGFILYHDISLIFQELTDEQAGQLIKYIVNYSISKTQLNPTEPTGLSGLLNAISRPFINHIDWDFQRYQKVCEKNRNNGKKGGRKKQKEPNRTQVKPIIDNREQIIDIKIIDKDKDKNKEISIEDFADFILENNLDRKKVQEELPICIDWFKGKGKVVKNWQATFRNWLRNSKMGGLDRYRKPETKLRGYYEELDENGLYPYRDEAGVANGF